MLLDFTYYNPTKIHFGKNSLDMLKDELKNYGETVLLTYGRNSIKKIGLYDNLINILNESGKKVVELSGVMSNPTYNKVLEGAKLVRDNNVDLILAVGGGSVIDCAKAISVSAYCKEDAFKKYWINFEEVSNEIVPVGSVLTMVGTGSEMNGGSVITHEELKLKNGRVFPAEVYPKFSILNPEYTFSVPEYQMISGVFDIMSHLMEQYFSGTDNNTTDYVIEGLLRSVIDNARVALKNPKDYEARSNIMWSATLALNTMAGLSKTEDWEVHMIEHQVGAYTDCAHGMGLATISIPYYRHIYSYGLDKFVRFAKEVWNVQTEGKTKDEIAQEGLSCLEAFIKECGMVTSLRELGATKEMLPLIANSTILLDSGYKKLTAEEVLEILEKCY
ncbi:iron-containing alcohol dehydrogenase [Sarcina ventriculi]|uniref:NADH-dependent butanol dehydrogenase A n=1 Tax=Sarcina ventriculi TaxID=1267 RepID=A0ABP2AQP7_SARVE|nr:iron-containing alcohol dehydrogenase [Sarcina ventriculi]CUN70232.1 NADH-dependent butanol dehydrogenase A [Sarcina ventriculi]